MRKRIAVLAAAALTMALSGGALGALSDGNGKGNPTTTPSGTCPPGQNQDTSTGGLKKC